MRHIPPAQFKYMFISCFFFAWSDTVTRYRPSVYEFPLPIEGTYYYSAWFIVFLPFFSYEHFL